MASSSGSPVRHPANQALRDFSREHRVITGLERAGHPHFRRQRFILSPFGGPVLARGGSGDLLAGIMGTPWPVVRTRCLEGACRAVAWHGCAADCLARTRGQVAVRTTELLVRIVHRPADSPTWPLT